MEAKSVTNGVLLEYDRLVSELRKSVEERDKAKLKIFRRALNRLLTDEFGR